MKNSSAVNSVKPVSQPQIIAAFASIYIIWGSTYLAIKIAVQTLPPFSMASARFLISGLILYSWARFRGAPRPTAAYWKSAAVIGTLLLLGGNGGVVWAEQYVQTGITALLIATVPIWMVILGGVTQGTRFSARVWAGLAAGFFGIWLLTQGKGDGAPFHLAGFTVLFLAAFLWAAGSVYSKKANLPESALLTVGMEMIAGGVALFLVGCATGELAYPATSAISAASLWALGYLIVFGSLFGFTAYIWLLKVSTLPRVSTYAYVNPVVAIALGHFFAAEAVPLRTIFAGSIILLGVLIIQSAPQTKS